MRRTAILLSPLLLLACEPPPQVSVERGHGDAQASKASPQAPPAAPETASETAVAPAATATVTPPPKAQIARQDLVATDLPPVPNLELATLEVIRDGRFDHPEGTDELAPRAAVALEGGLALVGQAYLERRKGAMPQTWRWLGVAPGSSGASEGSGTKLEPGAIRVALPDAAGGALLAGNTATGDDARGWFGTLDAKGELAVDVTLESKTLTEMFDLLPGTGGSEAAVVLGYMDAQGWVVSLDAKGELRWQKFVSSFGYTQIRAAARLDGEDMLAVGTRAQGFGESWWSQLPKDGGDDASPEGLTQGKLDIEGADPHQMLHTIVDLGEQGFIALGTAKRNHIQDHDQVLAAGFDHAGQPTWSRVVPDFRVTTIYGGQVDPASPGAAHFIVELPLPGETERTALGWLELNPGADGIMVPRQLGETEGWKSAGFVEGADGLQIVTYRQAEGGMQWRVLLAAPGYRVGTPR